MYILSYITFIFVFYSNLLALTCQDAVLNFVKDAPVYNSITQKTTELLNEYEQYLKTVSIYKNFLYKNNDSNNDWPYIKGAMKRNIDDKIAFMSDIESFTEQNIFADFILESERRLKDIDNTFLQSIQTKLLTKSGNMKRNTDATVSSNIAKYFPSHKVTTIQLSRGENSIVPGWSRPLFNKSMSIEFTEETSTMIINNDKLRKDAQTPMKYIITKDGTIIIGAEILSHSSIAGAKELLSAGYVRLVNNDGKYLWKFASTYQTNFNLKQFLQDKGFNIVQ